MRDVDQIQSIDEESLRLLRNLLFCQKQSKGENFVSVPLAHLFMYV